MKRDTLIRLLFIAVLVFGIGACLCACKNADRRLNDSMGPSMEEWLLEQHAWPAIPAVKNRDAGGRYLTPKCPLCGGKAVLSCTTWRCAKGHKYESPDDEISLNP